MSQRRPNEAPPAFSRIDELVGQAAEAEASQTGIAGWIAREDLRIDAERAMSARLLEAAQKAVAAAEGSGLFEESTILQIAVAAARHAHLDPEAKVDGERARKALRTIRVRRERVSRYADEVEALRAFHASFFKTRHGDLGRALARAELGADMAPSKAPREPIPDPWTEAVGEALSRVEDEHLLYLAHVEMGPPRQRVRVGKGKAEQIVRKASADDRDEDRLLESLDLESRSATAVAFAVKTGEGSLPAGSRLRVGPHVSAALLIAEHLGMLPDTDDEEAHAAVARKVAERIKNARRALRKLLQKVELDVPPRWVVPPPTGREQEAEARRSDVVESVRCCAGLLVLGGIRQPCREVSVDGPAGTHHPSAPWPRCATCGLPTICSTIPKENPCPPSSSSSSSSS